MTTKVSTSAQSLRANVLPTPTQAITFAARLVQHPSWAIARVSNRVQHIQERLRYSDWHPPANVGLEDGLRKLTARDDASDLLRASPDLSSPTSTHLYGMPDGSQVFVRLLYGLCRHITPDVVAETGVAHGFSSAAILQALSDNDRGRLVSIDLPHLHPQAEQSIGAVVAPALKSRWQLHLGPAVGALKRLLPEIGPVDLMVHDAAHTVGGQLAEYAASWPYVKDGGLLISDDVTQAFELFAARVGREPLYIEQPDKASPIGALRK